MAKKLIKGHIYWQMNKYLSEPKFGFLEFDIREWRECDRDGRVHVCEHSFEIDLPDDFDPRQEQIAMLDAEIQQVRAQMHKRITELQEQRSRLLALENNPSEGAGS